jgi:hypothetical protein
MQDESVPVYGLNAIAVRHDCALIDIATVCCYNRLFPEPHPSLRALVSQITVNSGKLYCGSANITIINDCTDKSVPYIARKTGERELHGCMQGIGTG